MLKGAFVSFCSCDLSLTIAVEVMIGMGRSLSLAWSVMSELFKLRANIWLFEIATSLRFVAGQNDIQLRALCNPFSLYSSTGKPQGWAYFEINKCLFFLSLFLKCRDCDAVCIAQTHWSCFDWVWHFSKIRTLVSLIKQGHVSQAITVLITRGRVQFIFSDRVLI